MCTRKRRVWRANLSLLVSSVSHCAFVGQSFAGCHSVFGPVCAACSSNVTRALTVKDSSKITSFNLWEYFIGIEKSLSLRKLLFQSRNKVGSLRPFRNLKIQVKDMKYELKAMHAKTKASTTNVPSFLYSCHPHFHSRFHSRFHCPRDQKFRTYPWETKAVDAAEQVHPVSLHL